MNLVDLEAVEIGCAVWERAPEGTDYQPRGGTVVGFDETRDPDTGFPRRAFVCVDLHRGQLRRCVLRDDQIGAVDLPNNAFLRSMIRKGAEHVYRSKGAFDSGVVEAVDLQARLLRVVMGL